MHALGEGDLYFDQKYNLVWLVTYGILHSGALIADNNVTKDAFSHMLVWCPMQWLGNGDEALYVW